MSDVSANSMHARGGAYPAAVAARDPVEEILNSITHAVGAGLSIAGLAVLMVVTARDPSPWKYAGFGVYGVAQILLYVASALVHGFFSYPRARSVLSRLDYSMVFVLIAGTYTPICLIALRDTVGWIMLGIVWTLALIGILLKAVLSGEKARYVTLLYLPMGWLAFAFYGEIVRATSVSFMTWIILGGLCYTVGVVFFALRRLSFAHVIWHIFVLAGGTLMFLAYLLHIA